MNNVTSCIVQSSLILLLVVGHWFDISEAHNVSIAVVRIIVGLILVAIFMPPEKIFTSKNVHIPVRVLATIVGLICLAIGNFITGAMYLILLAILWTQRKEYFDKLNSSGDKAC